MSPATTLQAPFAGLGVRARNRALVALGVSQAALTLEMLRLERAMIRTGGPGIIPFELAGTPARAAAIMSTWGADGQRAARRSLLMDYPYLVNYAALHALACAAARDALSRRGHDRLAAIGPAVAWGQIAAGGCDVIENAALLAVLAGSRQRAPGIARAGAQTKFALLAVGWGYLLVSRRPNPTRSEARSRVATRDAGHLANIDE